MEKPNIKERKQILLDAAELYKKKIRQNVNDLYGDVENRGKKVLIIGGVLIVTYGILDLILKSRKNKTVEIEYEDREIQNPPVSKRPKKESFIIRSIKEQIAAFIMALAKQTLNEVLENLRKKQTETEE